MSEHIHSILIIKNHKDEYLQYFDNRWDSFLFPNCKLTSEFHKDLIEQYLSEKLNLAISNFNINYIMDKVHTKFSESAKVNKEYHHYFYNIQMVDMPEIMQNPTFKINDITFKWFSLNELENDERIQKINSDIVSFVKDIERLK